MEGIATLIEYFELNDGEIFGIQQVDAETKEILDQILLERHIAIEMAQDIFLMFGVDYDEVVNFIGVLKNNKH